MLTYPPHRHDRPTAGDNSSYPNYAPILLFSSGSPMQRPTHQRRRRSLLQSLETRQLLAGDLVGPDLSIDITDLPAEILDANPGLVSAVANDGVADNDAIDAAIAYLAGRLDDGDVDSATVQLPAGTFELDRSIVVRDAVAFVGAGVDATVLTNHSSWQLDRTDILVPDRAPNIDTDVDVVGTNRDGYLFQFDATTAGAGIDSLTLSGSGGDSLADPSIVGGVFTVVTDDLDIRDARFDTFLYAGIRGFGDDRMNVFGNHFLDAGGRQLNAQGELGRESGAIFMTYQDGVNFENNLIESSPDNDIGYFGIKGRLFADSRIHHNTIRMPYFAIELPFELDRNVEIDHNYLEGAISVPRGGGGLQLGEGEAFHIHHNYFTNSYAIEGSRNGLLVDNNVFDLDVQDDGDSLYKQFGNSDQFPGPVTFTNNLVVNPGRHLFSSESPQQNLTIANNLVIANQTTRARDASLIGINSTNVDGDTVDWSTFTLTGNIVEVAGRPRPLITNPNAEAGMISDNTLSGVTEFDSFANPDTGMARGPQGSLQFNVGVDGEFFVDGPAIAAAGRNAVQPVQTDTDGDGLWDNIDPSIDDAQNGLGRVLADGQTIAANFNVPDGTDPLDPSTGLTGVDVNPSEYPTFYADDVYGGKTSLSSQINNGRLQIRATFGVGWGSANDSNDDYGFLVNTSQTDRFDVTTRVVAPEGGFQTETAPVAGLKVGDGTQASHLRFYRTHTGNPRLQLVGESGDQPQDVDPTNSFNQNILLDEATAAAASYDLTLRFDRGNPSAVDATPIAIAYDADGNVIGEPLIGRTFRVRGGVADAVNGVAVLTGDGTATAAGGLFAGVFSGYYGDRARPFTARFDSLSVTSTVDPPADTTAPTVESIVINQGEAQRSIINRVDVTFDEPVFVTADDIVVQNADGQRIAATLSTNIVNNQTVATLIFNDPSAGGQILADGDYTIRVLDTITDEFGNALDGDNDGVAGGQAVDQFHRLYGDANGDRIVNFPDFLRFINAYASRDETDLRTFDQNDDGVVNLSDFFAFVGNYAKRI